MNGVKSSLDVPCPVCGSRTAAALCDPWRGHSMISDMRLTPSRLGRVACTVCGLVRREFLPAKADQHEVFDENYSLFAGAPTDHARTRHGAIASWIANALGDQRPASVLDFGCGDGALLEALGAIFSEASLLGIEPAPGAVREAKRRGVNVIAGFGEDVAAGLADLCVSVNVIEHVSDPVAFLRAMRSSVAQGGRVVVACPDGDIPNYELMFHDHLYSFSRNALELLCARADLVVIAAQAAPANLGPFHLVVARPASPEERPLAGVDPEGVRLSEAKDRYLSAWSKLENVLLERVADAPKIVIFGNGDVAGLLRAYAPKVWARVSSCVVDGAPAEASFLGRPLTDYQTLVAPQAIVLGLRPGSQDAVAERLTADGHRVIRWNDLIAA